MKTARSHTASPVREVERSVRGSIWPRLCLLLGAATVASLAGNVWLLKRAPGDRGDLLLDESVKQAAIDELVERTGGGGYDSFPDPAVGRVMQPGVEHYAPRPDTAPYSTNRLGLRERDFSGTKPDGVFRIVLLGDSFVFGLGVEESQRVSALLESALEERRDPGGPKVEVLGIGVPSWNVVAECTYLRRSLHFVAPDVVVQVVVRNDLNDNFGVRGFGAMAQYSDAVRDRADSIVHLNFPREMFDVRSGSWLASGLDGESRERFARAAQALRELRDALLDRGAKYRLVSYWSPENSVAKEHLFDPLGGDVPVLTFSSEFARDDAIRLAPNDPHWSVEGSRVVAEILYGFLESTGALESLSPRSWDRAETRYRATAEDGDREAREPSALTRRLEQQPIANSITFPDPSEDRCAQVHGGIERSGLCHPYASLILAAGGTRLHLEAERLGAAALEGEARLFVDEFELTSLELAGSGPLTWDGELPEGAQGRAHVSIRIESPDFVYDAEHGRLCHSLRLRELTLD